MAHQLTDRLTGWVPRQLLRPLFSIKGKLIGVFIILLVSFIWVLAWFSVTVLQTQFNQILSDQQFASAQSLAAELDLKLRERINALAGAAESVPANLGPATLATFLAAQRSLHMLFPAGVGVIGLDGKLIGNYPASVGRLGVYYGDRDYFKNVLAARQPYIARPVMGRVLKGPILMIAVPILDAAGNVRAVMTGITDLKARNFLGAVSDPAMVGKGEFFIMSKRDAMIVASTDPRRALTALPERGKNLIFDRFLDGEEGSGLSTSSEGIFKLYSGKHVPVSGWLVLAALPTSVAYAPVQKMHDYLFVVAGLMTLLAIFIIQWITRRTLSPLEQAGRSMQRMTQGRTPLTLLAVERDDEVGLLIGNFNQLAAERQRYEAALAESEQRFRMLVESTPGMVFQCEMGAQGDALLFSFVSEGAELLFGMSPATMQADPHALTQRIVEPDRDAFFASLRTSAREMSGWNWEGRALLGDGTEKWINFRATPRNSGAGTVIWAGVIFNITDSKRDAQALRQSSQMLRELSAHTENVREEERKRIAREVHDELGQALTVLRMDLSMLRLNFGARNPPLLERILAMTDGLDRTITIMRHITSSLRPVALDLGLMAGLEWLVEEFIRHSGIDCRLRADGFEELELPDACANALFRIVQESLTNIVKHAHAKLVTITLEFIDDDNMRLKIQDDGRGFNAEKSRKAGSFGLIGMRERALMLHGTIDIVSVPGAGTCVEVCMSLSGH